MSANYAKINVSVDCVIFGWDGEFLNVLLIEQKMVDTSHQNRSRMALPGDLILQDEGIDDAAHRILKELTNLEGINLYQFEAFGDPMRVKEEKDMSWLKAYREDANARVITIAYFSLVRMDLVNPEASSFAENTIWKEIHMTPDLAFDHNKIVNSALKELQKNVAQNTLGFELLPQKFTLSQVQDLHEAILDKRLDKRNFRKGIKKLSSIVPLDEKQIGVTHKPGQLFIFNKKAVN